MFYLFLLAHLVADFALQPLWLVHRKRRWDGLLIHVGLVLACMLAIVPLEPAAGGLVPAMLLVAAVHLLVDWWKVRYGDRMFGPPVVPFLFDQLLHVATLGVVLGLALPAGLVWRLDASALVLPAIYASGYVVAACAVPIALIVALDPGFQHVALAAAARARCLLAAAVVLSLALFAGPAALPVTLAGYAVAASRPASSHPLDTPAGLLAVLIAAATLGALIASLLP